MPGECPRSGVEEEALRLIRPGPGERRRAEEAVREALLAAREALRRAGYKGYVLLVEGSYAKDTWLRGELDIDLFALFDPELCSLFIEGFAERVAPVLAGMGYRVEVRYAQHPYVRFQVKGFWAELVPGCRVRSGSEARTAVDRTPFHTEYVRSRLPGWARDEVRLLKSFMKGVGVYGAEVAVRGFSGYLAELLIVRYRCFRSVLEAAASEWRPPVEIVVEEGLREALPELRRRYPGSAMYVPDPVDPRRNVAAAVSRRSLAVFILASRLYLEKPCSLFFHAAQPPPPSPVPADWGPRLQGLAAIRVEFRGGVAPDTAWGVLDRLGRALARSLSSMGVPVARRSHSYSEEKGVGLVVLEAPAPLPRLEERRGPPAWAPRARVLGFARRHSSEPLWVEEDGSLHALAPRRRGLCGAVSSILGGGQLPRSLLEHTAGLRLLCGAWAAWEIARQGGRWAWEEATGTPYWLWLARRRCGEP